MIPFEENEEIWTSKIFISIGLTPLFKAYLDPPNTCNVSFYSILRHAF